MGLAVPISSLEDIVETAGAYQRSRVLQVAAYLDVFTLLSDGPRTGVQLAERTRTEPERLERLLIACCALGLLRREGETFSNAPVADRYLVRGREQDHSSIIRHGMAAWLRWNDLPRDFRPDNADDKWGKPDDFILGMHNIAASGRGQHLAHSVDLTGRRRLLDMGGGPGTYSAFLCRANPGLQATVWDLPGAVAIARRLIAQQADVRDRITCEEGDWNTDEFGEGYDCLLMSNVLHGHGSQAETKFAKAHRALEPGGLMIVQDFILNDTRDGPPTAALFNVYIGAFTFAELSEMLAEAGFGDVRTVAATDGQPNSIMTAVRP